MTTELVKLALRAVTAAAPNWALWLGTTSFVVVVGILSLFYERCRLRPAPAVAEDVEREPPEGERTGSYLLDDLLDKAEQALREKLEPTIIGIGSSQGTGDEQLDELLHQADTALREKLGFGNGTRSHGKKLRPVWLA